MKQITFASVFDTPTIRESNLESEAQTPDGRIWVYLKATEAISQYMVVSNPANTAVTTVSSSTNGLGQIVYITEASAGWTAGDYQDHWAIIISGTGEGQVAKIKDNTTDTLELYPEYAFATALAVASSAVTIRHAPDAEKVAVTTDITPCKGVAQVAFSSADYGYFLKHGTGGVLAGAVITINVSMHPGDDTEGTVDIGVTTKGEFDENTIGRCLVANTTADKACLAFIDIRY